MTLAAASLMISACGGSTGSQDKGIQAPVKPGQKVVLEKIPAGSSGGYAKTRAALKSGNAPDLAQVEYQEIPSFLLENGLVNLSRYGADKDKSKFVD